MTQTPNICSKEREKVDRFLFQFRKDIRTLARHMFIAVFFLVVAAVYDTTYLLSFRIRCFFSPQAHAKTLNLCVMPFGPTTRLWNVGGPWYIVFGLMLMELD